VRLHHLGDIDSKATVAVLTGDPDRVDALAEGLGRVSGRWHHRGYLIAEAHDEQGPVLVASTGIGGPSTAIAAEELGRLGVDTFVRVGTCGSMQKAVRAGDIVLSSGAVRDDGTSHAYLAPEIPAVPDFGLTRAVLEEAERERVRLHVGVTHSKDAYYAEEADGFPLAARWRERWTQLRAAGVLATEMEAATLFAVAASRSWAAAALLVAVDDSISAPAVLDAVRQAARLAAAGSRTFRKEKTTGPDARLATHD
jgi:uridine phosphorylase